MTSSSVQTIIGALNEAGIRYARRVMLPVAPGVEAAFVAVDDLIRLKRSAGRPQDLVDAEALERLRREQNDG